MSMPDRAFIHDPVDLQRIPQRGLWPGLSNLWQRETRRAWGGFRWLFAAVIWLLIVDGIVAAAATAPFTPSDTNGVKGVTHLTLDLFFWLLFTLIFTGSGMIISAQNQIIGERQSGTAAWIMSKPVTAGTFILAKCAALPKLLLTQVLLPFILALVIFGSSAGALPSPLAMLFAVGIALGVNLFFYSLTLLLGTFLRNRTPILAIGFFGLFIVLQASSTPLLGMLVAIDMGQAIGTALALIVSAFVVVALLLWGAIWRFGREEF